MQRYKITCGKTWPNHHMSDDRTATQAILKAHNFDSDATYGKTKVFIQNAQTVFELERIRDSKIPGAKIKRAGLVAGLLIFCVDCANSPNLSIYKHKIPKT